MDGREGELTRRPVLRLPFSLCKRVDLKKKKIPLPPRSCYTRIGNTRRSHNNRSTEKRLHDCDCMLRRCRKKRDVFQYSRSPCVPCEDFGVSDRNVVMSVERKTNAHTRVRRPASVFVLTSKRYTSNRTLTRRVQRHRYDYEFFFFSYSLHGRKQYFIQSGRVASSIERDTPRRSRAQAQPWTCRARAHDFDEPPEKYRTVSKTY